MKKILFIVLVLSVWAACKSPSNEPSSAFKDKIAKEKETPKVEQETDEKTVPSASTDSKATEKDLPVSMTKPLDSDYLMGKFVPSKHPDFTVIKTKYASRNGMYMRKDAYSAFQKMHEAAIKDGVNLKIISATRPFDRQRSIWEAKWTGSRKVGGLDLSKTIADPSTRALKILEYSSMPGTSRHHWGTDIDLNN